LRPQRIIAGLAFTVALFCVTAHAWPQAQSATHAILRLLEDQWLHAKTAQEAARFLALDFIGVSTRGVIPTSGSPASAQRRSRLPPRCTLSASR